MLEPNNPESIQEFGWSQITPIVQQIISTVLPKVPEVCKIVLKTLDKKDFCFSKAILNNMNVHIANAIVQCNGIEVMMAFYSRHKKQIYMSMIMQLLNYQSTK